MFDIGRIQSLLDRIEEAILLIQHKAESITSPDDFLMNQELPNYANI